MRLACAMAAVAAMPAYGQGMQWFSPNAFDLTCSVERKCLREQPCKAHKDQLVIRNQIAEGPPHFELPEGAEARGVVGVTDGPGGQTLLATASPAGQRFYRIVVFSDGDLTINLSHNSETERDTIYYGTCVEAVS